MAFCRDCGVQLREGDKFCSNCGASVDGTANPSTTVTLSIDTKKLEEGILEIKDAVIHLFRSPFRGISEAHKVLNPFSSYLLAILLSLVYGLSALWTKSAVMSGLKLPFGAVSAFERVGYTNGKIFGLAFLTVIICIAVICALLFLVSNVMLKQANELKVLLNAASFPFVLFLGACIVENIVLYINFKVYLALLAVSIIFLVVYLYHSISQVIIGSNESSAAGYTSAAAFICVAIVFNIVMLNNVTSLFIKYISDTLKNTML